MSPADADKAGSLTRYVVGVVLSVMLLIATGLTQWTFSQINGRIENHERRVSALEVALAALLAQQNEMHRSSDQTLSRIEKKLDDMSMRRGRIQ